MNMLITGFNGTILLLTGLLYTVTPDLVNRYLLTAVLVSELILDFIIYLNAHVKIKSIKKKFRIPESGIITIETQETKEFSVLNPLWYLLYLALTAGAVIISLQKYLNLPPVIATHFDMYGTPDRFADKSYFTILALPASILLFSLLFAGINTALKHAKKVSGTAKGKLSIDQERRFRLLWSIALFLSGLCILVVLFTAQLTVIKIFTESLPIMYISIGGTLLIILLIGGLAVYTGQSGSRFTVNFGHPVSWVIIAAVIILASLLLGSCATSIGYLASPEQPPNVQPWEDGLRTDPDKNAFEWWYFDASFSDGSSAVIVFSTKSILDPAGKPDPEVNIVITDSEGNIFTSSDKPGMDNFSASSKGLYVKTGNSFAKGSFSRCKIHYSKNDISADLELVSQAPPWRPGSGKIYFDGSSEKYFAWLAAIPYGRVKGTLRYNGKTVEVAGSGYHDHNWGSVRLNKVMTQWYWGRSRIDDYTIIFSEMLTAPKYGSLKLPVFFIAKGNTIILDKDFDFTFKPDSWKRHNGGRDYPEEIQILVSGKDTQAELNITDPKIIEAKALLEGAPRIIRTAAGLFVNPYYFRFKSNYDLELLTDGKSERIKGDGIFEIMMLRGKQTIR